MLQATKIEIALLDQIKEQAEGGVAKVFVTRLDCGDYTRDTATLALKMLQQRGVIDVSQHERMKPRTIRILGEIGDSEPSVVISEDVVMRGRNDEEWVVYAANLTQLQHQFGIDVLGQIKKIKDWHDKNKKFRPSSPEAMREFILKWLFRSSIAGELDKIETKREQRKQSYAQKK